MNVAITISTSNGISAISSLVKMEYKSKHVAALHNNEWNFKSTSEDILGPFYL